MEQKLPDLISIFAQNLSEIRRERGLSQEELAHLAGTDRTYVSSCERRVRNPSLKVIERLSRALEIEAYELLVRKNEPKI